MFNIGSNGNSSVKLAKAEEEDFEDGANIKENSRLEASSAKASVEENLSKVVNNRAAQVNEENELRAQTSSGLKRKSSSKEKKLGKSVPPYTIPLNPMDRNSSQIFYAQSQANALCLEDDLQVAKSKKSKNP
jgi:hypothetical protein